MTTLTVNIDDKKSEKAVKAVLDALGLSYSVGTTPNSGKRPLNKMERHIFNNLKNSLEEIQLHQQGKIQLRNAREFLDEL
jgi:hypothetical protein